jgi:beta propeller repeat protein
LNFIDSTFGDRYVGKRMKSRYFSIFLASMFSISISAVASAGQEIRITSDGEVGFYPAIYDDKVIWLSEEYSGIIHMRDLSTGKEVQITNQSVSWPAIYGDRIVWMDRHSEVNSDIYVCDLSTKKETRITTNRRAQYPEIYGNRIVWEDFRSGFTNIYIYDLTTKKETQITTNGSSFNPAIYDDRVVWMASRNESWGVYMYDISTHKETQITANGGNSPAIYGDRTVYKKNNDIYLYNISTSTEIPITTGGSVKDKVFIMSTCIETPITTSRSVEDKIVNASTCLVTPIINNGSVKNTLAIYGDRIVWADWRNENYDIYMYDLSANEETQITTDKSDQLSPVIYGDKLVWQSYCSPSENNCSYGIYIYNLSDKPVIPFASFSTNVTSGYGNVPLTVLFTDTSDGGTPASWYWDFGDDINSKHAQTATHTFTKLGAYNVSLTVTNAAGSSTLKKSNCITVTPPQAPVADFFSPEVKYGVESIPTNETVSFVDNSTGSPTSWLWDFGDGATSTAQNPKHIYNESGGYIITLTVKNEMGSDTVSKHGYVIVDMEGGNPIHPDNFTSNVTSGTAPLTVLFITGDYAYGWDWNFGDGTYSDNRTPVHTYSKPGKYTVKLRSYDVGGQSMITKHNYITVTDPSVPLADFSANVTSGPAPLVVLFTDTRLARSLLPGSGILATASIQNTS